MALRLVQLDETNRPALEALLVHAWRQNWGAELARALVRWRYYDRPTGGDTWLACSEGQCVAMLDSFVRPYLLEGRRILVREGCDWYCLPKYRPLGLGVRLMRELMAAPEPGLAVGGSDATLAMLPRLGWTRLPDAYEFVLPVTARGLAGNVLRARWPHREAYAKAIPEGVPLRPPRRARTAAAARVVEWRPGTPPADLPAPRRQGLVQLLEPAERDWLVQIPRDVAEPLGFQFFLGDTPVGFSLSQIEPTRAGFEGCMIYLQIAERSQAVVDWLVSETAAQLAARGAGMIRCWASSPEKVAALRRSGFGVRKGLPSYWWPKPGAPAPAQIDAACLRADDSIPLPALHGRHLETSWLPPGVSRLTQLVTRPVLAGAGELSAGGGS
jgi:hypothetical protein